MSVPAAPSALLAAGPAGDAAATGPGAAPEPVLPVEDLMREHGVLGRVLLVYEAAAARLAEDRDPPPGVVALAAGIVRTFIEDYHEKLEEKYLFSAFKKEPGWKDLVETLHRQHDAGRRLTAWIARHAAPRTTEERRRLAGAIAAFVRMYRPHKLREDTVLFPAFHAGTPGEKYRALGETFEDRERELFGEQGFGKMVEKAASLEREMGIADLEAFTPGDPSKGK